MNEPLYDSGDALFGLDFGFVPQLETFICFRCGVCCHLRVFLGDGEAERISAHTGLPLEAFLERYDDPMFRELGGLIMRQTDGHCFFLKSKNDKESFCGIYEVRPRVCSDFVCSLHRSECQKGLKLWNISATPSGRLEGDGKDLEVFEAFLKSLV